MMRHVLVPGLLESPPVGVEGVEYPRFPALETRLARADTISAPPGLDAALLSIFQLEQTMPVAPLCWLGETGDFSSEWLLQATPVHFRADRDRLLLFQLDDGQLNQQQAEVFVALFNQHFAEDGLSLKVASALRWYLFCTKPVRSRFMPLSEVVGRSLAEFMPEGEDAHFWRGVINETQMLFFQHQEMQESSLPVSGLWFSGAGKLSQRAGIAPGECDGDYCLLSGLQKMALETDNSQSVHVIEEVQLALGTQDGSAWQGAMERVEKKIRYLSGASDELVIYPGGRIAYHWRDSMKYRFWRKKKPLDKF